MCITKAMRSCIDKCMIHKYLLCCMLFWGKLQHFIFCCSSACMKRCKWNKTVTLTVNNIVLDHLRVEDCCRSFCKGFLTFLLSLILIVICFLACTTAVCSARCQGCVSSRWGCNWCIHQHVCTHKHTCSQGVTIYNQNVSPWAGFWLYWEDLKFFV